MPYSPTTWVDGVTKLGPTNLNHLETGLQTAAAVADAAVASPAGIASSEVPVWNGSAFVRSSVTKIGTGSLSGYPWANADISGAAAIAYSKLALALSIVNGDIAAAAAIALSKLADPGSGNVVTSTGSGAIAAKPPGYRLDYAQITSGPTISGTTEGAANAVITGNAVTYDGTQVLVEVFIPGSVEGTGSLIGVILRDSTVLGQFRINESSANQRGAVVALVYDTPSAASHTYKVQAFTSGGGSGQVLAGAGGSGNTLPAFLKVTKA